MPDFAVTAWIRANGAEFNNKMAGMRAAVSGFGSAAKSAFERSIPGGRALTKIFSGIAGQVAIGNLVSRGITALFREAKELVLSIPEFAEKTMLLGRTATIIGVSAEAWQRWSYAAKMTDTSAESLQNAMQKLNRNMADLTVGKGTLMDLMRFGPPGLARMIMKTHDTTEAMLLLADSFEKVKDPQIRARMAVAAFGKAGQDLIPMLALGRAGLQKLIKEAGIYSSVLDNKAIAASEHFEDSLKQLRGMFGSVKDTALSALVQALNPYVDKVKEWLRTHEDLIKQKIPEYIDKIVTAAKNLWDFIGRVKAIWDKLNNMANGKLLERLIEIRLAWSAITLAIGLAKAAQTAFTLLSGAGAAAGAGAGTTAAAGAVGAGAAVAPKIGNGEIVKGTIFAAVVLAIGQIMDKVLPKSKGMEFLQSGAPITDAHLYFDQPPPATAPNANAQGMRWNGHIWVHADSGTSARVGDQSRGAPPILGMAGANQ